MILQSNANLITSPYDDDPTNRWIPWLTNAQHHSMKAVSASKIKDWLKMSDKAWHSKHILGIRGKDDEAGQKKAFALGTIIHMAVLEPEKFETNVIVCDLDQRTNAYKDWINEQFGIWVPEFNPFPQLPEAQQEVVDGAIVPDVVPEPTKKPAKKPTKKDLEPKGTWLLKQGKNGEYYKGDDEFFVVTPREMAMFRRMQKNVEAHKLANQLIRNGTPELSGVARDPETGLYMNIRGDCKGDGYFIDVKTTGSCSYSDIKYAMESYNYPIQHVHYLETANLIDGAGAYENFAYLFISKEEPYEVVLVKLDPLTLGKAAKARRNALRRIAQCEASGRWGSVDDGISGAMVMELSKWYDQKFKQ